MADFEAGLQPLRSSLAEQHLPVEHELVAVILYVLGKKTGGIRLPTIGRRWAVRYLQINQRCQRLENALRKRCNPVASQVASNKEGIGR